MVKLKQIESFDEFKTLINGEKPIIIDFTATWCGPCKMIGPVFEKLSENVDYAGIGFYQVDVDERSDVAQEVGVKSMPTFITFKGGNKVGETIGASPANLQNLIKSAVALV